MASLTSSPLRAPIASNSIFGGGAPAVGGSQWSGKKRRPVDPEETGAAAMMATSSTLPPYDSEVAHLRPQVKRPRTIDDVLGSMSLRPPDPPGNFGHKRKSDDDEEDGRSAKVARSSDSSCASSNDISADDTNNTLASQRRQMDPSGRKGESPTNVASDVIFNPSIQQQLHQGGNAAQSQNNNLDIDMSIDDIDHESDSSVSEGSIRNAMYQLVFGRRNNPPPSTSLNGSTIGCGPPGRCYDAVDTKIEDLIRRSRLEAAIKSQKTGSSDEMAGTSDMDMDDMDEGEADEDDEWHPGHG